MATQKQDVPPRVADIAMRLALAVDRIIFDPGTSKQLLQMLGQGQPANALARAAMAVLNGLREKAKGIPPQAIDAFIPQILGRLGELAAAAKLFSPDKNILNQALALVKKQGQPTQPASPQQPAPAAPGLIGRSMQGAPNAT
jgi:hypothetical protein